MTSPGTDTSGLSLPSTAISISRAFGTAASMTIFRSNSAARSIAAGSSLSLFDFRDADARSEVRRLDEDGISQLRRHVRRDRWPAPPIQSLRSTTRYFDLRQSARREHQLRHGLVHADRRGEHAGADVGDVGELEQPLNRAVLAVGSMQHRETRRRARGR